MREKLRRIRKEAGYTQQSFAEIIGVSRNHYAQIENGGKNPSTKVWIRIKEALKYPYDDIFFAA